MRIFSLLFPLFITLFLTSCQVKEGASSDLISGHRPATNSFVLPTPTTKTYGSGENLNLSVSFPFDIIKDKAQTFKWKVEGNKWHHNGKLSNGLTIEEVWERVEKK